ncbi:hypothetical protein CR513_52779 [Mucuna pruriens]|uniref:Uncharacterized protein n=1 Tax=Mucuna pruriens TaxID=157652 RepID=A0A371EQG4_MUCPR|nr:hypothetical protein CR513_52779 [Mucuna pruriens]
MMAKLLNLFMVAHFLMRISRLNILMLALSLWQIQALIPMAHSWMESMLSLARLFKAWILCLQLKGEPEPTVENPERRW